MTAVRLVDLVADVRSRADMIASAFVDDATEVIRYINEEAAKLHDLVVSRFEDQYTTVTGSIVVSGASSIAVTNAAFTGFYKLRGIDRQESGAGDWREIKPFNFNMRNRRASGSSWYRSREIQYRLVGANILLTPDDACDGTYRVWYIPSFVPLAADGDTVDFPQNWHEFITAGAAAKCLSKEESDPNGQLRMQADVRATIMAMAANRDAGHRMRIEDVRSRINEDDD